ncbi:hypothetical protein N8H74_27950 [Pseudomonas sp. B2M1-30]|uniref:hypothetical protein n=1 Tax=Pseudomonas TaxID=286 RepID=UPI0021C67E2F|nr:MULTISPECIES: hypothetical protein [Pseudomonas]MCU0122104.1 hypothetical protein [Pseudomonas sp. B2M1-30]MCU7264292.1 hypothetical protein [Pseudomonas koreensis]
MTKEYSATLIEIDSLVDELVVLLISGIKVRCFTSYCPHQIEVGKTYKVELEIVLPDAGYAEISNDERIGIDPIGEGFSCAIYGYLNGDNLQSFVDFPEQEIHYDYPSLNERYVKVIADRINVSFV